MARLLRTRRARRDLIDIWRHIAADDEGAADRMLDRFEEVCQRLAHNPLMGAARHDIRPGMRYFAVGSYVILYRVSDAGVEIIRVVHGRRNLYNLP